MCAARPVGGIPRKPCCTCPGAEHSSLKFKDRPMPKTAIRRWRIHGCIACDALGPAAGAGPVALSLVRRGALAALVAAVLAGNLWLLDWVHVMSGVLWTGIDLFMGFVIGPIIRSVSIPVRREIIVRLTPVTLFLMPTLSILTSTAGWFLAVRM